MCMCIYNILQYAHIAPPILPVQLAVELQHRSEQIGHDLLTERALAVRSSSDEVAPGRSVERVKLEGFLEQALQSAHVKLL